MTISDPLTPKDVLFDVEDSQTGLYLEVPSSRDARFVILSDDRHIRKKLKFLTSNRRAWAYYILFKFLKLNTKARRLVESDDLRLIKSLVNVSSGVVTLSTGTPGPLNKATLLLTHRDAAPIVFAKIACSKRARWFVDNEFQRIAALRKDPLLRRYVPAIKGFRKLQNLTYLATEPSTAANSTLRLEPPHISFMRDLFDSTAVETRFSASKMQSLISTRLAAVTPFLSSQWAARLNKAIDHCTQELGETEISMSLAHRDFAPWNIRISDAHLLVFDWEYSDSEYIALYDLLHFLIMPVALKRKITSKLLRKIKFVIRSFADKERGLPKRMIYKLDVQLMLYLVDLCLFYISENGNLQNDAVVSRFAFAIDNYECWRG